MGAINHPYGRHVETLSMTPVHHWSAFLVPVVFLSTFLFLTLRILTNARERLLQVAQQAPKSGTPVSEVQIENSAPMESLALFAPEVRAWEEQIVRWSNEYALTPTLIAIVMQIESCGALHAESGAGAKGLFQVMPFHFAANEDPFEPETNATRGLTYLARAYDLAGGSIAKTLAGYNGGHSVIDIEPAHWAEETNRYVAWGTGIWDDIQAHKDRSETLEKWLAAGGSSLCLQARNSLAIP